MINELKILDKVDWKVLQDYIDNNLIVANKHPEYDIWILNYSPKAQIKKIWDLYTLSCRGLVIDVDGNILARPFQKFKNLEEYDKSEIDMSQEYEVFVKMDGSLGIMFYYKPRMQWIIASRGSFISEQCVEAQKMFNANNYDKLDINYTYLYEIIYPENRIVVDYGYRRELILLAVIETISGQEMPYTELFNTFSKFFTVVKKIDVNVKNLIDLKKLEVDNREGFVVRFKNGFRVKVKFSEYVRLHGILTNVSNLTVWEHLMNNYDFDTLFDRVPDEFYDWLKKTINILQSNFNEIERQALKEFIRIYYINGIGADGNKKDFAFEAIKTNHQSILFKLYDKKPYDEVIWKMVRPEYSKPFSKNNDYLENN